MGRLTENIIRTRKVIEETFAHKFQVAHIDQKEPVAINKQLKDVFGRPIGQYSGVMFFAREDLMSWMNKEMLDMNSKDQILAVEDTNLLPIAILEHISVLDKGKGTGTQLLDDFFSEVSIAKYILLIADLKNEQEEGFNLVGWYRKKGFETIGRSSDNHIVMLKKN